MDFESITDLWKDYEAGKQYQANVGMASNLPRNVKFYEGDQWPKATQATKNMPRPVINIIKMICRAKKSAILSTPVRLVYSSENQNVNIDKFNRFAEYITKEMGMDSLDKRAIDDGVKKGSYFYHFYWDSEAKGKSAASQGGVRCEIIDPLNIFFANPQEHDEQKQKWIIIASREEVSAVRAKADNDINVDDILPDEFEDKYGTKEQDGTELCTVLTRYFRNNGEVYWERATKTSIVNNPVALSPDVSLIDSLLGGTDNEQDAPNNSLPDSLDTEALTNPYVGAYLYPIVAGSYEQREKSIYGLSEVEGLIPNQKSINFMAGMTILNAQENAWGKYITLPGALKGQVINNEPGQILTDWTNTGNGIRKLTEQSMQGQPMSIINEITALTRTMTGSTEVMTGEVLGANMSGSAIAQLQSQASKPIEELRRTFWLNKEKQGMVLAQFFKLYYSGEGRQFAYEDEVPEIDIFTGNIKMDDFGQPIKEKRVVTDVFVSDEYADVDFSVVCEACAGTSSSAAGDINALDTLLAKGLIDTKTYLKAYPNDALSNKSELIKGLEESEQSQMAMAAKQIEQLTAELEQAKQTIAEQEQTTNNILAIVSENKRLKAEYASLYAEATNKINQANNAIMLGNQKIQETTSDATAFAEIIRNGMEL